MMSNSRMYATDAGRFATWSPFVGCEFNCAYCVPSFQAQAKRQKQRCLQCYEYTPHEHPERLERMPKGDTVFVCSSGDISFARPIYVAQILAVMRARPSQRYYLQSKAPAFFEQFLELLPANALLLTTLETNRCHGYGDFSRAPCPAERWLDFYDLCWGRKAVTVEPLMDFDVKEFTEMIVEIEPKHIWIGYNTRPTQVALPEPEPQKVAALIRELQRAGIEVRGKDLRGLEVPS